MLTKNKIFFRSPYCNENTYKITWTGYHFWWQPNLIYNLLICKDHKLSWVAIKNNDLLMDNEYCTDDFLILFGLSSYWCKPNNPAPLPLCYSRQICSWPSGVSCDKNRKSTAWWSDLELLKRVMGIWFCLMSSLLGWHLVGCISRTQNTLNNHCF